MEVRHFKVSPAAATPNPDDVDGPVWNEAHVLTGLVPIGQFRIKSFNGTKTFHEVMGIAEPTIVSQGDGWVFLDIPEIGTDQAAYSVIFSNTWSPQAAEPCYCDLSRSGAADSRFEVDIYTPNGSGGWNMTQGTWEFTALLLRYIAPAV